MAYTANWPNFLNTIKSSPKTKLLLSKLKLPSDFLKHVRDPIVTRNRGLQSERYRSPAEV